MGNTDHTNSKNKIRLGFQETEHLMGQKEYNLAMIKARQTMEYMVNSLNERACIVDGDLMTNIDELYQGNWIKKSTCEHFHKIRTIGNKAVHEGNDSPYDADQVFHLLTIEIAAFLDKSSGKQRTRSAPVRTSASRSSSGKPQRRKKKQRLTVYDLLKVIIGILVIVLIALLVKFVKPIKEGKETTAPTTTESETTVSTSAAAVETTTATIAAVYKTTSDLKVRSSPSKDNDDNKLGILSLGSTVNYIKAYDDEWTLIQYNGKEAYVASKYLTTD